jgi:crotonobetainyl-CoA:carnitine CoA-transferase CaiB-like acyl-CoA transferase
VIAANADNPWQRLCHLINRPDLLDDQRFKTYWDRAKHAQELDAIIGDWVAQRDSDEIDKVMNEAGVVCSPVYTVADIFEDPQYRARDMLIPMQDPELGEIIAPGVVPKLSETPGAAQFTGSWLLGSHNNAVYGELLGMSTGEIGALADEGVV